MTAPDITTAAIEAAARAIHESRATPQAERLPWEQARHLDRMYGRLLAKAALEAAVPVLLDSHRELIAREIEQHADKQAARWPHRWTMDKLIGWQGAADVARGTRPKGNDDAAT